MKKNKTAVTLVEMLMVIAVIMIMTATVIALAAHFDNQGKQRLVKSTFALIETALEQYHEFGYTGDYSDYGTYEREFYNSLTFPPDCNGFTDGEALKTLLVRGIKMAGAISAVSVDPNLLSIPVMYFFLDRVPACRVTLDKIDRSLVTNKFAGLSNNVVNEFGFREYPFWQIIDPWGTSLRYDYYINEFERDKDGSSVSWANRKKTKRPFPVLTSAGPDKEFGTEDDISSER